MSCFVTSPVHCLDQQLCSAWIGTVAVVRMDLESASDDSSLSDLVDAALLTRSEDEVLATERAPTTSWARPSTPRDLKEDLLPIRSVEQDFHSQQLLQCNARGLEPLCLLFESLIETSIDVLSSTRSPRVKLHVKP